MSWRALGCPRPASEEVTASSVSPLTDTRRAVCLHALSSFQRTDAHGPDPSPVALPRPSEATFRGTFLRYSTWSRLSSGTHHAPPETKKPAPPREGMCRLPGASRRPGADLPAVPRANAPCNVRAFSRRVTRTTWSIRAHGAGSSPSSTSTASGYWLSMHLSGAGPRRRI